MKKLLIAIAAMMIGVVANAAAMNWGITKTVMDAGSTAASGNAVYFFIDSGTTTQSAIMTAFANGTTDFSSVAFDTATLSSGKASGAIADGAPTSAVSAYYIVIGTDRMFMSTATSSSYDNLTSTGSWTSPNDTVASMSIKGEAKSGYSGAGWYTAAVPEPTSGLMLVLGLGLMALKRKRT